MKLYRFLPFALVLFAGCKHSQDCPAFSEVDAAWLVYHDNDTAKFTNGAGSTITFVMGGKQLSSSYTEACGRGEPAGYYCKSCIAEASVSGTTDSVRGNGHKRLTISMRQEEGMDDLSIGIYDIHTRLQYNSATHQPEGNTTTVTLGGTTYGDVYFYEQDTLNANPVFNPVVSKIYYNRQFGILGFYDRQTHSLFYRE